MTVAQTLPASRETVENSAAPNAMPNPTSARRNLTQTSAAVDCSHCATRPVPEAALFDGFAYAEFTGSSLASTERTDNQDQVAQEAFVTSELLIV
jgi:hypothetical protein